MEESKLLDFKHDVRNPLYIAKSLIENHLEFLEEASRSKLVSQTPTETEQVLKRSAREISRVLEIIRKLNHIASKPARTVSKGKSTDRVKVQTVLERVVRALKGEHYIERLFLVESVPNDLPEIEVNSLDLEEIFYNLIVNAAQAMLNGGQLTIEASSASNPRSEIIISFRDTGHGIPEEVIPYIFEPFFTGRFKEGGVGFGLYIVKQLMKRNGGQIIVQSQENVGTTFTLTFPIEMVSEIQ